MSFSMLDFTLGLSIGVFIGIVLAPILLYAEIKYLEIQMLIEELKNKMAQT